MMRYTPYRCCFIRLIIIGVLTSMAASVVPATGATEHYAPPLPCPPPPATPGVPPPPLPCDAPRTTTSPSPSAVCLRLTATPGTAVTPDQIVTYQVVAQNRGQQGANNVVATFPIIPTAQTVLDVQFSDPQAWVRTVEPDALTMELGSLEQAETITTTIRLHTTTEVPFGTVLATRLQARWAGLAPDTQAHSNAVTLTVDSTAVTDATVPLPLTINDDRVAVTYDDFASYEPVSRWYHQPDGTVIGLPELRTDALGQVTYDLDTTTMMDGDYMLVTQGQCSQVTATGWVAVR